MAGVPVVFRDTREKVLANYNWEDIITGQGYITLYPTMYKETYSEFNISSKAYPSMVTSGLIGDTDKYIFQSNAFERPLEVDGVAYINAYATGTVSLKAKLQKRDKGDSTEGSSTATSAAEVTNSTTSFVLVKTITVNDYVNNVTYEARSDDSNGFIQHKFYTHEAENWTVETGSIEGGSFVEGEADNPNKERFIHKIEVWLRAGGTGDTVYYKNADVIAQDLNITDISSEITSASVSNTTILMALPLTRTRFGIGEKMILQLTIIGGGDIVLDPTNTVVTNESLEIQLPVKVTL